MAPVIWLSVTVASVVATCVIRFGNTRCAQALSWPRPLSPRPPVTAPSAAGRAAAAARQLHGGASAQGSVMCTPASQIGTRGRGRTGGGGRGPGGDLFGADADLLDHPA